LRFLVSLMDSLLRQIRRDCVWKNDCGELSRARRER
jgi:hypothetical protein